MACKRWIEGSRSLDYNLFDISKYAKTSMSSIFEFLFSVATFYLPQQFMKLRIIIETHKDQSRSVRLTRRHCQLVVVDE